MTRNQSKVSKADDEDLKKALAVLISCTRSKRRPFPLTHIARWLDIAVTRLGSYGAVADRIGLSPKMLKQFACIQRLTKPVQQLFETRKLDSVDAAAHLAMLPAKEQEVIAGALAAGEIDTADVRAAVQLRHVKGSDPIQSVLHSVKESKTKQEYIAEFVIRGSHTHNSMLRAFQKHIPKNEILRLEVQGALGRLVLTRKGKVALVRTAQSFGKPVQHVIATILSSHNLL
jgi:DNA-binding transcriptional regulator YdaS (Cro superfamily)